MPTLYLLIAAIAGPLLIGGLTYGVEELRQGWAIDAAVTAERARGDQVCAGKIAQVGQRSADDALAARDAADAAVANVKPVPVDKAALKSTCNADVNCRERGQP